jgi:histidine ammonia-lyase
VDSIVSSNGQEDHVSMGANAATKLFAVINNVEKVLAIELLNAVQALSYRKDVSSSFIQSIVKEFRKDVSFLNQDRILSTDIENSISFLQNLDVDAELI